MLSKRLLGVVIVFATIVLLCLVTVPDAVSDSVTKFMPKHSGGDEPPKPPTHPIVDRTFLLLKTGIEVAYTRLPAHFQTTLQIYPHHAVYGDTNDTIDGVQMIDSIAFLDEDTLNHDRTVGYRVRRQMARENWHWQWDKIQVPGEENEGWNLDRFKNVPAFAHAYLQNPTLDWYVMIDADSYLLASTLNEVTKGYDPAEPLYFGKGVGGGLLFAHGGSGIVLSRGALQRMFGDTQESMDHCMARAGYYALWNCCGDSVVSQIYSEFTEKSPRDTLQENEVGQFQGTPISHYHLVFSEWCNPAGSFHRLPPWEIATLYDWERSQGVNRINYVDFYHKFILPEVVDEKPNWSVDFSNQGIDVRLFPEHTIEAKNKDLCRQACANEAQCTMWVYLGNQSCTIFRNSVARGAALNPYSPSWKEEWSEVAMGYMVDRIQDFRQTQDCDTAFDLQEGYQYRATNPDSPGQMHVPAETFNVSAALRSQP